MNGLENDLWVMRRSEVGQWAGGTAKALMAIALWALLVWGAVSVFTDSGLLRRPEPSQPHSPAGSSPFAQTAYG